MAVEQMASRNMLVVVHDCAPPFVPELQTIVAAVRALVSSAFSLAVVPRWQGESTSLANSDYRELLASADERLLHGWTHQSASRFRPISWLTCGADELAGRSAGDIQSRITSAVAEFTELTGAPPRGLLPPAWRLPVDCSALTCLEFVVRFRRVESCRPPHVAIPLATWNWDWGRFHWSACCGEWLGAWQLRSHGAVPCIALHPADVRRGLLPCGLAVIRRLLDAGHVPGTFAALIGSIHHGDMEARRNTRG
jgi:hypothetical protein